MSQYTYCNDQISDLYKDAYGMRPGEGFWQRWQEATDAERQEQWDWLLAVLERRIEEDRQLEKLCVEKFEALVSSTIQAGAGTRETALRWIMDSSDCNGDWDFLAYEHGLSYGYFRKVA